MLQKLGFRLEMDRKVKDGSVFDGAEFDLNKFN